ncbi:MAG: PspC domain-containing protein [Anaerovorax sp.]
MMGKLATLLLSLLPLITLLGIFIITILVIKGSVLKKKNGNSYQSNQGYKMLCKSQSNRIIAGVCGGIAQYFGCNATVVRLFFLFSGVGLLSYSILAMAIPDSNSPLL